MNIKQFAFLSFIIFIIGTSVSFAMGYESLHLARGAVVVPVIWGLIFAIEILTSLFVIVMKALE